MKIVDSLWFNAFSGTVGIVIIEEDITHKRKAYIGVGSGLDQEVDAQAIISMGSPFSPDTLGLIARRLNLGPKKLGGEQCP